MRFDSESDRKAHSLASFIPASLLRNLFSNSLSEFHLDLMRSSFAKILPRTVELNAYHNGEKLRNYLCIAFSHPDATSDQLMELAKGLEIPENVLFKIVILLGRVEMLNKLLERLDHIDVINKIKSANYDVFIGAIECGHLSIFNRMLEFVPPHELIDMLTAGNYGAFRLAVKEDHPAVINRLMELAPSEVENMIKASVYDALYLRQSHVIDRLKKLAPSVVDSMISSYGTRIDSTDVPCADTDDDVDADASLHAVGSESDLNDLTRSRESSMYALTSGEEARLAAATIHYQPMIKEAGVDHLLNDLRETLLSRFQDEPATIIVDGKLTVLPAEWEEFKPLKLTTVQREQALKAYFKNKDHTAYRYLSRPNPWMSPDASYVYVNPVDTNERWSTFEDHLPLIAMLWLAANDASMAPTDEHTLEGRIDHFVAELALIGRAHNWDCTRIKLDEHGSPVLDESGKMISEEYDDLHWDRPSCTGGVKRRLLQSVIGHPLLVILTEHDIRQELQRFVLAQFKAKITVENRAVLLLALTDYCCSYNAKLADAEPLRVLDISAEQQTQFIRQMAEKYHQQFIDNPTFKVIIENTFALEENESNPPGCMHALKFATTSMINLELLLQPPAPIVDAGEAIAGAGAGAVAAPPPPPNPLYFFQGSTIVPQEVGTSLSPHASLS